MLIGQFASLEVDTRDKCMQMIPSWFNRLNIVLVMAILVLPIYAALVFLYGASPLATDVGYRPLQPVPFSHALHAGQLGMDCRYCHVAVERSAQATLPTTSVCMNCHQTLLNSSERLQAVRNSYVTGASVRWVRVHDLPDFAYFDHSAHVRGGIGCVSCHGRVDQMDERGVYQDQPLSMGWCLECHRDPSTQIRPRDQITLMDAAAANVVPLPTRSLPVDEAHQALTSRPSTDCSTCHR